jgi:Pyruvate/2-oxoacid:ferredoxin oxidoreductase delta subunit
MAKRKIVKIDEDKCTGCGICIPRCVEGALRIVNGKAKLVSETYCDGLGACLGKCPEDAITIEERESQEFDIEAANKHIAQSGGAHHDSDNSSPITAVQAAEPSRSMLRQWPVQLALVSPNAPFLKDADLLLIADCVPFAFPDLHTRFLKDNVVLVACPKLDDSQAHMEKLGEIIRQSGIKSITVLHMEVPCCSGLVYLAKQAIATSKKDVLLKEITIGIDGNIR